MRKIALEDIQDLSQYERIRNECRDRIIEIKKDRRLQLGPLMSFLFENKETVLFQIQEMIRLERTTDPKEIQRLIDSYQELVPQEGELSLTMFIELVGQARPQEELARLRGIDGAVFLKIGLDTTLPALFEEGGSRGGLPATVQYLKFFLIPNQIKAFERDDVWLAVDHPNYNASAKINGPMKEALLHDLGTDYSPGL